MKIEDVFENIANRLLSGDEEDFDGILDDQWTTQFIKSVFGRIEKDLPISTKQANLVIDIIERAKYFLDNYKVISLEQCNRLIQNPVYRHKPYKSFEIKKEVRHLGSNLLGFRFKNIKDGLLNDFQNMQERTLCFTPYFDYDFKLWVVPVTRFNIRDVVDIIRDNNFQSDEATDRWLKTAKNSFEKPSQFTVEEGIVVAAVNDNPLLASWMLNVLGAEVI